MKNRKTPHNAGKRDQHPGVAMIARYIKTLHPVSISLTACCSVSTQSRGIFCMKSGAERSGMRVEHGSGTASYFYAPVKKNELMRDLRTGKFAGRLLSGKSGRLKDYRLNDTSFHLDNGRQLASEKSFYDFSGSMFPPKYAVPFSLQAIHFNCADKSRIIFIRKSKSYRLKPKDEWEGKVNGLLVTMSHQEIVELLSSFVPA
jgi:hypothetical protein